MLKLKDFRTMLVVVLVITMIAGCRTHPVDVQEYISASPSTAPTTVGESSRVAPPVTWQDISASYARVTDYTCLYFKEEHDISRGDRQTIRLSFRKPLDVRLDWLNDKGHVDQSAIYRQGLNDGKVLARQNGLLGTMVGTLSLKPDDPLALQDSQHPITEAGLGTIVEHLMKDASDSRITQTYAGEEMLDGHAAWKFVFTTGNGPLAGLKGAVRSIVWIDKELKLPVKVEIYDHASTLLERHRFTEIKLNPRLTDQTFKL
jgi:outer membrane lipoprotein-sorting protein